MQIHIDIVSMIYIKMSEKKTCNRRFPILSNMPGILTINETNYPVMIGKPVSYCEKITDNVFYPRLFGFSQTPYKFNGNLTDNDYYQGRMIVNKDSKNKYW